MIFNSKKTLDPAVILLSGGVVFFTVVILACVAFFPTDGQTFQIFGGAFTALIGALLGFLKGQKDNGADTPTGGGTLERHTDTVEKQTIAPEVKKD